MIVFEYSCDVKLGFGIHSLNDACTRRTVPRVVPSMVSKVFVLSLVLKLLAIMNARVDDGDLHSIVRIILATPQYSDQVINLVEPIDGCAFNATQKVL